MLLEVNHQLEQELSERKRLESQLIQAQKMESIGQLAAGVAHEINNPLSFILSNLGTLNDYVITLKKVIGAYEEMVGKIAGERPIFQEMREPLERVCREEDLSFVLSDSETLLRESREGAIRLKEIVEHLKSFARLDEAQWKPADLNHCIEVTLKIIWNELKYKCTVHQKLQPLPATYCNASQLNQVFMNLLVNAAHAIPERGEITIETMCRDERERGEREIEIRISDTGEGIPPEHVSRIFEPFFTTKPVGKGTGLGLSISFDIIRKHGGIIEVESTPGQGSTFIIRLPVQTGPPVSAEPR